MKHRSVEDVVRGNICAHWPARDRDRVLASVGLADLPTTDRNGSAPVNLTVENPAGPFFVYVHPPVNV